MAGAEAPLLLTDVELDGTRCDVLLRGGRVAAVGQTLRPGRDVERLDAKGGALLPGLHDHHAHLLAFAAARESLALRPPRVVDEKTLARALRARDHELAPGQWLRAVGYHESIAGPLDRRRLDAAVPDRPVRVQHRGGALWILNSCALALVHAGDAELDGIERDDHGVPNGRLHRLDDWVRARIGATLPDLDAAVAELNGYGITGITDATPFTSVADVEPLAAAARRGLPMRMIITGTPGLGRRDDDPLPRGPRKIVIADHRLPGLDELSAAIRRARDEGRAVALHSLTLESLLLALASWHEVGSKPGDRLEHGAVVPAAQCAELARLGIVVVTQPGFVAERGDDLVRDVDPRDLGDLYPCRSLLEAGVGVAFSTDAPFGGPDPWAAIAAATSRQTASGAVLQPAERVSPHLALGRFLGPWERPGGPARRVQVGGPADLCLLRVGLGEALAEPSRDKVAATIVGGRVVARSTTA